MTRPSLHPTIVPTSLPGVLLLKSLVFKDSRGEFSEIFNQDQLRHLGINVCWNQTNLSFSKKNVIRGLHFQWPHPQTKLLRVLQGRIFDITVDVRPKSRTFGKWQSVVLRADEGHSLYVPAGFAHGFCALEHDTALLYACTDTYHSNCDHGIIWNDPDLAIPWPTVSPIISERDQQHPPFHDLLPWLKENIT